MVMAYIIADRCPDFDLRRFRDACKSKSSWFLSGTSTRDYIIIIEKIYNSGRSKKKIKLLISLSQKNIKSTRRGKMDINKWKSCAVDMNTYCIIRAMGKQGFRRPGSMIAKIVDDEVKKIAKKEGKSYQTMKENLLLQGKKLLNGK